MPIENTKALARALDSFLSNRDNLNDYTEAIDTLFVSYIVTDDYISLSKEKRIEVVTCVNELKMLIKNLL